MASAALLPLRGIRVNARGVGGEEGPSYAKKLLRRVNGSGPESRSIGIGSGE
jgi:hypothetical protein